MDIETTNDLAEKLADWLGIYGGCKSDGDNGCTYDKSKPLCCRQGFVESMKERMTEAVENDKVVNPYLLSGDELDKAIKHRISGGR